MECPIVARTTKQILLRDANRLQSTCLLGIRGKVGVAEQCE